MKLSNVPVPDVYRRESADFRFFLKWFEESLQKIKYDHDHISDLYDPLRCPKELLWMLSDTMGYKYDDRLPPAFCRLVLLYFMSMIRLRGSKNGVTLAAEVNLAQHNINAYGQEKEILYNRLEDTSVPVNSVSVIPHVKEGYIDVVYFSTTEPIDACLEYVRPVGMYLFARPGVTVHARTKIWVDAMLTDKHDRNISIGPTKIGHYSREDYARLQKMRSEHGSVTKVKDKNGNEVDPATVVDALYNEEIRAIDDQLKIIDEEIDAINQAYEDGTITEEEYRERLEQKVSERSDKEKERREIKESDPNLFDFVRSSSTIHRPEVNPNHTRNAVWKRNSKFEVSPDSEINPGYRALYDLQMSNNEHIVKSLIPEMFSLGYGPHEGDTEDDDYFWNGEDVREDRPWDIKNLRHRDVHNMFEDGWSYLDDTRTQTNTHPRPRVNPILTRIGDAITMNPNPLEDYDNSKYTKSEDLEDKGNNIKIKNRDEV